MNILMRFLPVDLKIINYKLCRSSDDDKDFDNFVIILTHFLHVSPKKMMMMTPLQKKTKLIIKRSNNITWVELRKSSSCVMLINKK